MHLECRNENISDTISKMGVPVAFTGDADFSGTSMIPYPGEVLGATGLKISKVVQQAWLDVDEKGAEAAAATATMEEVVTSNRIDRRPPIVFRADKPFLFLLRDRRTGLILFMGRYVAPTTSG